LLPSHIDLVGAEVELINRWQREFVLKTNSKISESPNVHQPVILYDATSKGTINYLNLAREFLTNNKDAIRLKSQRDDNDRKKAG